MKKLVIICLLSCSVYLMGQEVPESLAIKMANAYYQEVKNARGDTLTFSSANNTLRAQRFSPLGKANMWFVPVEDGWILLSGNMKMSPVLAHIQSHERPMYDSFPPAAQELLNVYEENLAYINQHESDFSVDQRWQDVDSDESVNRSSTSALTEVRLTMDVHWGQTIAPGGCNRAYNKFCPPVNAPLQCNKAAAGCVAVAIAQIMWYWKWPYAAYIPTTVGGSNTELKFYDWSMMPSQISSGTPMSHVNMIAGLLRDCGYSLDMDYGVSSGASSSDALSTLESYGYNSDDMELRSKWNTSGWTNKLRSNIDNGQPVYYAGQSAAVGGSGHAFIVDGYRTGNNPTYHINWGWYNNNDGWYNIDDAYVDSDLHYEYYQEAIFGIRPTPLCTDGIYNGSFPQKFCLVRGGDIIMANNTLSNISEGKIYSSTKVRLTSGVTIQNGSNVHIAIKAVPCNTSGGPEYNSISVHNSKKDVIVSKINQETQTDIPELSQVLIYSIDGKLLRQTSDLRTAQEALSNGIYIIKALTRDGKLYQSKIFINN